MTVRCEWYNDYEKGITKPPIRVSDLEVVELNFRGECNITLFYKYIHLQDNTEASLCRDKITRMFWVLVPCPTKPG